MHVAGPADAAAYAAVRMPATYAATRAAMAAVAEAAPAFSPRRQLDVGSGPGTAAWAAAEAWDSLESIVAVEGSAAMAEAGRRFWAARGPRPSLEWRAEDVEQTEAAPAGGFDLVTLAYVLNELRMDPGEAAARFWRRTEGVLLIVEPGTPAGWRRILAARGALVADGAHLAAPCPHAVACPLAPPDWCHFAQRVPRSREHRLAKGGELGWEDEKFIYVAASRSPVAAASSPLQSKTDGGDAAAASRPAARVLMPPRMAPGRVWLKLCQADGTAAERLVTKRAGEAFRQARRAEWGDRVGFLP